MPLHRLAVLAQSSVRFVLSATIVTDQLSRLDVTQDVVYGHKDGMALTFDVFQLKDNPNASGLLFMVSGRWVFNWTHPTRIDPRSMRGLRFAVGR